MQDHKKPKASKTWLALLAALALAACAPIPRLAEPARPLQGAELGLREPSPAAPAAPALAADWWRAYGDAELDALMQRALAQHPSLAQAQARIARAAAAIENAEAAERPVFGISADATRQRYTEHGLVPPPIAGSVRTNATLQAGISYDWDFFGRHAAALQAALGNERAARADAAAARLNLSAAIARGWLDLARALAQRELLAEQLRQGEQSLALVRQRVAAGLDGAPQLRSAETPLPELRRQDLALQAQAELLRHQLAALSAQPAEALASVRPRLPRPLALDAEAQLGVDLLGRRPDVAAARWRVEATTQNVAEARAQFYPNVTLSAFAGFSSLGLDQLLKSGSQQLGFGPSLRLPIFDTGRLRAQYKGSAAERDAAVAAYNGALLEALRDAGDQYSSLRSLQLQGEQQGQALAHVQASRDLARQRFEAGLGNYLAVLSAEQNLLSQRRLLLDLQGLSLDAQVALVRSLGGGWSDDEPPR
ncbi:efflux transporter outer membrane subunit [Roseateles sp. DAIF2]|uniref:efflux transporter outer membrane subunit n=1 Tax=Roseateles sp. DAIF2 TaxID=2714952 RepID=UPI0018A29ACB|nr:efflux transporter outer membrane subunit [Roseateles sp. DAIF2]QPF73915.1 efflux transporter outer membrane subunit [Roseateles sp. DAIF2]